MKKIWSFLKDNPVLMLYFWETVILAVPTLPFIILFA